MNSKQNRIFCKNILASKTHFPVLIFCFPQKRKNKARGETKRNWVSRKTEEGEESGEEEREEGEEDKWMARKKIRCEEREFRQSGRRRKRKRIRR